MKNIILLTIISTFIFSCNKDLSDSIASDIEFMAIEVYSNSSAIESPTLKLRLKTIEEFPCVNYNLATTEFINDNELIIRFENILEPSICLTAIGPAISEIDLPENINKLTFINGNVIDSYNIIINNQEVDISIIQSNFTNSLYEKTFRYPENSFAFVCGTNTTNTYLYDDFLNILLNNQSLAEFNFNGVGRIPYPESSSGHWVNHPSRYFKYINASDFENLGQILSDFTTQNITPNSGVTIRLISWDNRKHLSWIN